MRTMSMTKMVCGGRAAVGGIRLITLVATSKQLVTHITGLCYLTTDCAIYCRGRGSAALNGCYPTRLMSRRSRRSLPLLADYGTKFIYAPVPNGWHGRRCSQSSVVGHVPWKVLSSVRLAWARPLADGLRPRRPAGLCVKGSGSSSDQRNDRHECVQLLTLLASLVVAAMRATRVSHRGRGPTPESLAGKLGTAPQSVAARAPSRCHTDHSAQ